MKKVLIGLMLLSGLAYADYPWNVWYNQNPIIPGNLSVSGSGSIGTTLTVGTITTPSSLANVYFSTPVYFQQNITEKNNISIGQTSTAKNLVVTSSSTFGTSAELAAGVVCMMISSPTNTAAAILRVSAIGETANATFVIGNENTDAIATRGLKFKVKNNGDAIIDNYVNSVASPMRFGSTASNNITFGGNASGVVMSTFTGANGNWTMQNNLDISQTLTSKNLVVTSSCSFTCPVFGTKTDAALKLYTPIVIGEMWVSSTDFDLYIATGLTPYGFKKYAIANPD